MHSFWFVYFTGMIKISAFYSSLKYSPIGFIPIIFPNQILHTGILTVEVPLCVCTGVNGHLLVVKYKKRKLLTCVSDWYYTNYKLYCFGAVFKGYFLCWLNAFLKDADLGKTMPRYSIMF